VYDLLFLAPNSPFLLLCESRSEPLKYFSFARWLDFKVGQYRMFGKHCRRESMAFPSTELHAQPWAPAWLAPSPENNASKNTSEREDISKDGTTLKDLKRKYK
jgi:hypothetical protein